MFERFDFSVLDLPSYKEDSVREDIVAPVLHRLGYSASGDMRMDRSRSLSHPFVNIGSKSQKIHIIPDYTLYFQDIPLLVLDAKAPSEAISKSTHVEQAFSYAIHPDIRAPYYGLCNGRNWIIYGIMSFDPVLTISTKEIDEKWHMIEHALLPKYLLIPELRDFRADYGMILTKFGLRYDCSIYHPMFYWLDFNRVEDGLYTSSSTIANGGAICAISFDYNESIFNAIMDRLPVDVSSEIRDALRRQPFSFDVDGKIIVTSKGHLGSIQHGQYEEFAPIILDEIIDVVYDPSVILDE